MDLALGLLNSALLEELPVSLPGEGSLSETSADPLRGGHHNCQLSDGVCELLPMLPG